MRFPQKTASQDAREEIATITEKDVQDCYQCMKCSAGCPFVDKMDYKPHEIIMLVRLGLYDKVFESETLWVCASCLACSSRCPRDIEPAKVMEGFRVALLRTKDQGRTRFVGATRVPRQAAIASMRKFRR